MSFFQKCIKMPLSNRCTLPSFFLSFSPLPAPVCGIDAWLIGWWPPGEVTSPATARSPTFSPTTDTEHEGRCFFLLLLLLSSQSFLLTCEPVTTDPWLFDTTSSRYFAVLSMLPVFFSTHLFIGLLHRYVFMNFISVSEYSVNMYYVFSRYRI